MIGTVARLRLVRTTLGTTNQGDTLAQGVLVRTQGLSDHHVQPESGFPYYEGAFPELLVERIAELPGDR